MKCYISYYQILKLNKYKSLDDLFPLILWKTYHIYKGLLPNSISCQVLHLTPDLAFFFNLVLYCPSPCYSGSAKFSPSLWVPFQSLPTNSVIKSPKHVSNPAVLPFFYSFNYLNLPTSLSEFLVWDFIWLIYFENSTQAIINK